MTNVYTPNNHNLIYLPSDYPVGFCSLFTLLILKKHDTLKYDTLRHDTLRHGILIQDTLRQDTLRQDTLRWDTLRQDTLICDTVKWDNLRCDTFRRETFRHDGRWGREGDRVDLERLRAEKFWTERAKAKRWEGRGKGAREVMIRVEITRAKG